MKYRYRIGPVDILYFCAISNLGVSYARKLAFSELRLSIGNFIFRMIHLRKMLGCLERSHSCKHKLVTKRGVIFYEVAFSS
jgi:hypothetical protein